METRQTVSRVHPRWLNVVHQQDMGQGIKKRHCQNYIALAVFYLIEPLIKDVKMLFLGQILQKASTTPSCHINQTRKIAFKGLVLLNMTNVFREEKYVYALFGASR